MEREPANTANQHETPNSEYDKWSVLANLIAHANSEHARQRPLEPLTTKTVTAIANTETAHPVDRQYAAQELQARQDDPAYQEAPSAESDLSAAEDLSRNYFGVEHGRLLVPTEQYRNYREQLRQDTSVDTPAETPAEMPAGAIRTELLSPADFENAQSIVETLLEDCRHHQFKLAAGAKEAYETSYRLGLEQDDPSLPTLDDVCTNLRAINLSPSAQSQLIRSQCQTLSCSPALCQTAIDFAQDYQGELLRDDVEQILTSTSPDELRARREFATQIAIAKGQFLPQTIIDHPEITDQTLADANIDKTSPDTISYALHGYNMQFDEDAQGDTAPQKAIAEYFDLRHAVLELMQSPKTSKYSWDAHSDSPVLSIADTEIDPRTELGQTIFDAIDQSLEQFKQNPAYEKALDHLKQTAVKAWTHDVTAKATQKFDTAGLFASLDVTSISSLRQESSPYLSRLCRNAGMPFKHLLSLDQINDLFQAPVAVDSQQVVKDVLLQAIGSGERWQIDHWRVDNDQDYWKEWRWEASRPATDVFDSAEYQANRDRLGINFADPEIFDLAMNGFVNVLQTKGGPTSQHADWYFEHIFSHHPDKFDTKLAELYKLTDDRSLKARITRFKNESPAYFKYQEQLQLDKLAGLKQRPEDLGLPTNLKISSYKELKSFIDAYLRRKVVSEFDEHATKVGTFKHTENWEDNGESTTPSRRKPSPEFFGPLKLEALLELGNSLSASEQVDHLEFLSGTFPGENPAGTTFADRYGQANLKSNMTYHGFAFDYEGHRCAIFESLNDVAATYFFRGEADDDPVEFFNTSKRDNFKNNPKVARAYHLSPEHETDSISEVHKKGFLFFRTGDRQAVNYKSLDNRASWNEYFDAEFPAYPMNIHEESAEHIPDLEKYKAWQNSDQQNATRADLVDLALRQHYLSRQ